MSKPEVPTKPKKSLIWALIVSLMLALGYGVFSLYTSIKPSTQVATGLISKALCSGVFVSRLPAERVYNEEIADESPVLEQFSYHIDTERKRVRSSLLGIGSTASFHPDTGCTIYQTRNPKISEEVLVNRQPMLPLPSVSKASDAVQAALDEAFEIDGTRAVLVWHDGEVIGERYDAGISQATPLKGWSMNKTIVGLLIGMLSDRGWLELDAPAPVVQWQDSASDSESGEMLRSEITLRQLLQMTSGLGFEEDYVEIASDVIRMLFASKSAAELPLQAKLEERPGTYWYYSSGTTNILSKIAIDTLKEHNLNWIEFLHTELFAPLNIHTAYTEADASDYYVGSSFGYLATHDWARLGILFANRGIAANGTRLISADWLDFMSTPNKLSAGAYGAQLWLNRQHAEMPDDFVTLAGHRGQLVMVSPQSGLVIVRLGETASGTFASVGKPLWNGIIPALN